MWAWRGTSTGLLSEEFYWNPPLSRSFYIYFNVPQPGQAEHEFLEHSGHSSPSHETMEIGEHRAR